MGTWTDWKDTDDLPDKSPCCGSVIVGEILEGEGLIAGRCSKCGERVAEYCPERGTRILIHG